LSGKYPLATGLEHDEMGHPTGSPKLHLQMTARRRRKLQKLAEELPVPQVYGPPEGNILLVGWGSTQGPIREAVDRARAAGDSVSSLNLRHISPLPPGLENIFAGFNHVIVVEMNDEGLYGYGQLAGILRARFCLPKIGGLNKTDGLTWRVREILERAKTHVAAGIAQTVFLKFVKRILMSETTTLEIPRRANPARGPGGAGAARHRAQTADEKRTGRRPPDLVPGLRRFFRAGPLFQIAGKAQAVARENRHHRRHRVFEPVSVFCARPTARISFMAARCPLPAAFRSRAPTCTFSFSAAMATPFPSAATMSIIRAPEHQDDLRHHGQLGLWLDQEANFAHFAAGFSRARRTCGARLISRSIR
jgi:hypothetical protein